MILAFCKFLEAAKDCYLPLSNIYLVWFTERKVTFLKQKFNGCPRERPQCNRDLFRAKTLVNWL